MILPSFTEFCIDIPVFNWVFYLVLLLFYLGLYLVVPAIIWLDYLVLPGFTGFFFNVFFLKTPCTGHVQVQPNH